VLGLGTAEAVTGHYRSRQAQAARQFAGQVTQDVAVEVCRHQDVESFGSTHQVCGSSIDQQVLEFHLGKFPGNVVHSFQEQAIGHMKAVGLVDGGDLFVTQHRPLESPACDPFAAMAGYLACR